LGKEGKTSQKNNLDDILFLFDRLLFFREVEQGGFNPPSMVPLSYEEGS
jgi:hypothetical protein